MKNDISYDEKIYKKFKVMGKNVLIEKFSSNDLKQIDGIYVPESKKYLNFKFGCGRIIDLGGDIDESVGVSIGDIVLYDYYSAHGDWNDHIITNVENLILKISEDEVKKFI